VVQPQEVIRPQTARSAVPVFCTGPKSNRVALGSMWPGGPVDQESILIEGHGQGEQQECDSRNQYTVVRWVNARAISPDPAWAKWRGEPL
jgi:hypothetical protein